MLRFLFLFTIQVFLHVVYLFKLKKRKFQLIITLYLTKNPNQKGYKQAIIKGIKHN